MLIKEASKRAGLTKKAVEYYIEQRLLCPQILPNGYRDFSEQEIERLQKIAILRKLGLEVIEIHAVVDGEREVALQRVAAKKQLDVQRQKTKQAILDKLIRCGDYSAVYEELRAAEEKATIAERLLDAFPGYYGRFVCLHFARFLNEPAACRVPRNQRARLISGGPPLGDGPPQIVEERINSFFKDLSRFTKWA